MKGFIKVVAVVAVAVGLMFVFGWLVSIAFVGGYIWGTK